MKQNKKIDYHAYFEEGKFYHVYNRGNNRENIFYKNENYFYFLDKWDKYLSKYLDVLAYCLIPNHFHFLVHVKEFEISDTILLRDGVTSPDRNETLEAQFRKFFISYSQAVNKQENRTGSLFQKRFKRILVDADGYIKLLINYIHHNPIHHGYVKEHINWKFSSYQGLISDHPSKLKKNMVIDWFGGRQAFINFHNEMINFNKIKNYTFEDN